MSKYIKSALAVITLIGLAWLFFYVKGCSSATSNNEVKSESATILLDRIEKVTKLITVEGYFSEVYRYKDYYKYDISLLRKEALLRIKAKVSVGYDLSGLDISLDESNKTVVMVFPDSLQILSIDHDLDYYDLSEGTFNSFDEDDYNKLEKNAKEFIRQKAMESDLMDSAGAQLTDMVDIIRALVSGSGYTLEIITTAPDESQAPTLFN